MQTIPCRGRQCRKLSLFLMAVVPVFTAQCAKEEAVEPSPTPSIADSVVFPDSLRADDESVNEFFMSIIKTCKEGDYETFRLLWSAHEEPITLQEFQRGWQADPKVTVLDLRRMRTEEGEVVYLLRALVKLDPDLVPEPERDVVLLFRKEHGQWRLARAPKSAAKVMKTATPPGESVGASASSNGISRDDDPTS